MEDLKKWLENPRPSYQDGFELLRKYNAKKSIIDLVGLGHSLTNLKMMKAELHGIFENLSKEQVKAGDYTDHRFVADELRYIMKEEFKRLNLIFNNGLSGHQSQSARCANAKKILEGFDEVIVPIQENLKDFEANGKLPDDHYLSKPEAAGWVDIKQQILNLRSYISKHRNNPERKADVKKWRAQLDQLNNDLNALHNR